MPDQRVDLAIIGAGIVGLSTAMHAVRAFPRLRVAVLEKEARVATHQSGHNSGVIHSGIYYKPGSLKARLCVEGAAATLRFCREHNLPCEVCGKVIVAAIDEETSALQVLFDRAKLNALTGLELLNRDRLREAQPHCVGPRSLRVPGTGITDYGVVSRTYAELLFARGGSISLNTQVTGFTKRGGETV